MSYILEALEKSEQERKQRAVPDLQTQHTLYPGMTHTRMRRRPPLSRQLWPAVVLVAVLVLAGWLYRDYLPVALEIKVTRHSEPSAGTVTETAPIAGERETQIHPAQQLPGDGAEQLAVRTPATAGQTGEERTATDPAAEPVPAAELIAPSHATVETAQDATSPDRPDVRLQPVPIIVSDSSDGKTVSTVPPLPFLEDLPASIRKELPELKFAGHTYSAASKNRLIIINSGIKREGDLVEPGLQLEEITWEGVILNFRGTRFQVITTGA